MYGKGSFPFEIMSVEDAAMAGHELMKAWSTKRTFARDSLNLMLVLRYLHFQLFGQTSEGRFNGLVILISLPPTNTVEHFGLQIPPRF